MNPKNVISLLFYQLRKSKGLDQQGLAEYLRVNQSTISRIEAGIHLPTMKLINKLCVLEQTDIENLLNKYVLNDKILPPQ